MLNIFQVQEGSHAQNDAKSQGVDEEEMSDTRKLVFKQNKKNKKSGGFQSMGNKIFLCFFSESFVA